MKIEQKPKSITDLLRKKVFLFDMDGTIYNEERLFEGVVSLLEHLRKNGIRYFFLTNNSSKSSIDYVAKLNRLGVKASKEEILTSTLITATYLKSHFPNQKVYTVGTKSMIKELLKQGINVVTSLQDEIKVVLVGNDNEMDFKKLNDASILLTKGASFIGTNIDLACPTSFGYVPDCGSICQMLTNATGKTPEYMGKPSSHIASLVFEITKAKKSEIVMIGDRLYTDMMMGINSGFTSICVLSGEATLESVSKFPHSIDFVIKNVNELDQLLFSKSII